MIEPQTIIALAQKQGWEVIDHKGTPKLIRLRRGVNTLDIYHIPMTVGIGGSKGRPVWHKEVELPELVKLLRKDRRHKERRSVHPVRPAMVLRDDEPIPQPQHYHRKDEFKMFEREVFADPEEILIDRIWKLKPKWYHNLKTRAALRQRAIREAGRFIDRSN